MQNLHKDLKKKFNEIQSEKLKVEQNLSSKIDIENEKIDILNRQIKDLENIISLKNSDLKILIESNKNLLGELSIVNANNIDLKKINDSRNLELEFSKKELEK